MQVSYLSTQRAIYRSWLCVLRNTLFYNPPGQPPPPVHKCQRMDRVVKSEHDERNMRLNEPSGQYGFHEIVLQS